MTSSSRINLVVVVLAAALGFGVARWGTPSSRDDEIVLSLQRQSERNEELTNRLLAMQVQLRELQARPPSAPSPEGVMPAAGDGGIAAVADAAKVEPMSPESQQALTRGHQLLEHSIARRSWGKPEVAEMRELMAEMNGPARLEISQAVAAALNRGDIKGTLSALFFE